MTEYPEGQCKDPEIHLKHSTYYDDQLWMCPGVGDNQEYVYRLAYADTGRPAGTYQKQHVYHNLGSARGQETKHNKSWRHDKVVIQRGLIQWSEDPV